MKIPMTDGQLEELFVVIDTNGWARARLLMDYLSVAAKPKSSLGRLVGSIGTPSDVPKEHRQRLARNCLVCGETRPFDARSTLWPLMHLRWEGFNLSTDADFSDPETMQVAGCPSHIEDLFGSAGELRAALSLWRGDVTFDLEDYDE